MSKMVRLLTAILCGVFLVNAMAMAASEGSPVKFSIDLLGEYTDNRNSAAEDEESNVDLSLRPRVDAVLNWEQTLLGFYYAPAYRYRTEPAEDAQGLEIENDTQLFHDLGINIDHKFTSRVKAKLSEKFSYTDDPSIQEGGATLRRDSSYLLNSAGAGVTYEITSKSWVDLKGHHMIKRYDEAAAAEESDEDNLGAGLTLWNQLSRTLAALAMVDVGSYDYESTIDRGFSSVSGGVGVENIFSPNLRGGVRVGLTTLDYDDSALSSEDAPFINLSVQAKTIPSTRITAGVGYGIKESYIYPFSSQEKTDASAKVEWEAIKDLTFAVSGTYRVGDYDSDSAPVSATSADYAYGQSGDETAIIATAEAAYKIGANSSIKFVQSYEDVDSDVSTPFTRNASTLVLSRQF